MKIGKFSITKLLNDSSISNITIDGYNIVIKF